MENTHGNSFQFAFKPALSSVALRGFSPY